MVDNYEVIKKLIGKIYPVGESHTDEIRYENLLEMLSLIDRLLFDVNTVANHRTNHQASMAKAGKRAKEFLNDIALQQGEK